MKASKPSAGDVQYCTVSVRDMLKEKKLNISMNNLKIKHFKVHSNTLYTISHTDDPHTVLFMTFTQI